MRTAGKQSLLLLLFYIFILYYILHHITHLVNHQKVILERKPAVISGQAFWKSNKNNTGTLVCSSDLSMRFLMFKDPHNPQFMALNHSFIQSCILKAWHLPLALDNTHTYRICDHAGEERRLFIEAWQYELKQGEAEVNVERGEPQLVFDPILKTENAALSSNRNISTRRITNALSPERVLIPPNPALYEHTDIYFFFEFRPSLFTSHTDPPHSRHQSRCLSGWSRRSNNEWCFE